MKSTQEFKKQKFYHIMFYYDVHYTFGRNVLSEWLCKRFLLSANQHDFSEVADEMAAVHPNINVIDCQVDPASPHNIETWKKINIKTLS